MSYAPQNKIKHVDIVVKGRVQGVFFRQSARERATELGIKGFARNMPDGSVHIEAEGSENSLNEFISWCRKGPRLASVQSLHLKSLCDLSGFDEFGI